jgi:hypothetical protein
MSKNVSFYICGEGHDTNKYYNTEDEALKALVDSPARFGSIYMIVYTLHVTPDRKTHRRMNFSLDGEDKVILHSDQGNNASQNVKNLQDKNDALIKQNGQIMNELWTLKSMVNNLESLITAVRSLFNIYKHQYGGTGTLSGTIPGRYEFNRILDILGSDPNKHLKDG